MSIEVRNVNKTFGDFKALKDVSFLVPNGKLVALLGPSGSGKTSLLRIIAGLEVADSGKIFFHGEDGTNRNVRERGVGFVFQHYALFRHMTVFENISFGLKIRPIRTRPPKKEIYDRVHELLKLIQLEWVADRYPSQLSGGQRQRVALARALAVEPKVLLLDEPFGALDAKVRKELRRWLRRLHDEINITSVFVTHDQEEALELADLVVVMNEGRIEQIGAPEEVYEHPANPFVFNFLGNVNIFRSRIHDGKILIGDPAMSGHSKAEDIKTIAYVRPHDIEISRIKNGGDEIEAIIRHIYAAGSTVRIELDREDDSESVEAELPREVYYELKLKEGESVFLKPKKMKVFVEDYSI